MDEYIKIKVELTDEMTYLDVINKYGIGEYDPADITISRKGITLTFYKKHNEINGLNKYI